MHTYHPEEPAMRRAMIVFGLTLGSFTMDGMALPMQAETDVFNLPLL